MVLRDVKPLLQRDFGERFDCTLTSITTVARFWAANTIKPESCYNKVEQIARRHFYNGEKWGTLPTANKPILREILEEILHTKKKVVTCWGKGIGYNLKKIEKLVETQPVVLSMVNDGANYYSNHTVTIIGVSNGDLLIYDNWTTDISRVSYKKVSILSCITFVKN